MPHQATLLPIGDPFIELPTVDSTNNYAMGQVRKGLANHGTAFFAHNQTAGKGQRGKTWTTSPGENIVLSVVLKTDSLSLRNSFHLSACIAVTCCEFFKKYSGNETSIKWPNDIYWRDRKAGGILIENIVEKDNWSFAIIGIGLNINQTSFDSNLPNPVSLKQITGELYDPVLLAKELCALFDLHYQKLLVEQDSIIGEYNTRLFKLNQSVRLRKQNVVFETRLTGVSPSGKLMTLDTMEREFDFGEIQWVL